MADSDGEDFIVERLLDFKPVAVLNEPTSDQFKAKKYDPSTGELVWIVKYLVKWKGYDDPAENTWEPRCSFAKWVYDEHIDRILKQDKDHPSLKEVKAEVKQLNEALRVDFAKEQNKQKAFGPKKRGRPPKSASPAKATITRSREVSAASASTSSLPPPATKARSTRNSGPIVGFEDFAAVNPRVAKKLRITPPPEKATVSRGTSADGARGTSTTPFTASFMAQLNGPDDDEEDDEGGAANEDAASIASISQESPPQKEPTAKVAPIKRSVEPAPEEEPRKKKQRRVIIQSEDDEDEEDEVVLALLPPRAPVEKEPAAEEEAAVEDAAQEVEEQEAPESSQDFPPKKRQKSGQLLFNREDESSDATAESDDEDDVPLARVVKITPPALEPIAEQQPPEEAVPAPAPAPVRVAEPETAPVPAPASAPMVIAIDDDVDSIESSSDDEPLAAVIGRTRPSPPAPAPVAAVATTRAPISIANRLTATATPAQPKAQAAVPNGGLTKVDLSKLKFGRMTKAKADVQTQPAATASNSLTSQPAHPTAFNPQLNAFSPIQQQQPAVVKPPPIKLSQHPTPRPPPQQQQQPPPPPPQPVQQQPKPVEPPTVDPRRKRPPPQSVPAPPPALPAAAPAPVAATVPAPVAAQAAPRQLSPPPPARSTVPARVLLSDSRLSVELRQAALYPKLPKTGTSLAERIKSYWNVGSLIENHHAFDQLIQGKRAFIYAGSPEDSIKSGVPGVASRARDTKADVAALQLILCNAHVDLWDDVTPETQLVFVHAREREELAKGEKGALKVIEQLRSKAGVFGFVFGECDIERTAPDGSTTLTRERWFKRFWTATAAITITPAAFASPVNVPEKVVGWLFGIQQHRNKLDGRRDLFAWAPATFALSGGGALSARDAQYTDKTSWQARAVYALHMAAQRGIVSLLHPFPRPSAELHEPSTGFPLPRDTVAYDQREWNMIEKWLPKEAWAKDVESTVRDAALYKGEYGQVRRWVVVATAEECERFKRSPVEGIEVCTFEEAKVLFAD